MVALAVMLIGLVRPFHCPYLIDGTAQSEEFVLQKNDVLTSY